MVIVCGFIHLFTVATYGNVYLPLLHYISRPKDVSVCLFEADKLNMQYNSPIPIVLISSIQQSMYEGNHPSIQSRPMQHAAYPHI
jgi:hypothetical protein